ncbi:MAG TPA: SRPBCC domain-containing protein [Chitinophagaceae bacterium]|nr:SRPBCC domain-containing protein [Chitinophagaceae bacterium]
MQNEVNQTWFLNRPPQEVWEYLTRPDLLEQWLMKSDFKPVTGHTFRFTHTPKNNSNYQGFVDGEVLEVNPVTRLSYTWKGVTKDGIRAFDSTVVWTLTPKENGTQLHLRHTGFTLPEDTAAHNTGWNNCMHRFEELLNTRN